MRTITILWPHQEIHSGWWRNETPFSPSKMKGGVWKDSLFLLWFHEWKCWRSLAFFKVFPHTQEEKFEASITSSDRYMWEIKSWLCFLLPLSLYHFSYFVSGKSRREGYFPEMGLVWVEGLILWGKRMVVGGGKGREGGRELFLVVWVLLLLLLFFPPSRNFWLLDNSLSRWIRSVHRGRARCAVGPSLWVC